MAYAVVARIRDTMVSRLGCEPGRRRFEARVEAPRDGITAVDCLAVGCPDLSRQQLKTAMTKGAVWLTHRGKVRRLRRAKTPLSAGASLDLYYDRQVLGSQPSPPRLIADYGDYSVWYKPFGMLAQGSKWGDHCAITRCVEKAFSPQRPSLVVHRLDRAATGLTLIAHRKRAAAELSALFKSREIRKFYRVVVHGAFPAPADRVRIQAPVGGREASTEARLLAFDPIRQRSLLDVEIHTGRKHQIRVHLADYGFPVVGDRLYGTGTEPEGTDDLQLTAYRLAYRCPLQGEARDLRLDDALLPRL